MQTSPSPRQQELADMAHKLAVEKFAPRAAASDRDATFPFEDYVDNTGHFYDGFSDRKGELTHCRS